MKMLKEESRRTAGGPQRKVKKLQRKQTVSQLAQITGAIA